MTAAYQNIPSLLEDFTREANNLLSPQDQSSLFTLHPIDANTWTLKASWRKFAEDKQLPHSNSSAEVAILKIEDFGDGCVAFYTNPDDTTGSQGHLVDINSLTGRSIAQYCVINAVSEEINIMNTSASFKATLEL